MKALEGSIREFTRIFSCCEQQLRTDFTNFDQLSKTLKNFPSVALVGNAGYLSTLEEGNVIDSHDLVIRMNNFKITGYEQNVGKKANIYLSSFYHNVDLSNPHLDQTQWYISSVPNNYFKRKEIRTRHCFQIAAGTKKLKPKKVYTPSTKDYITYSRMIGAPPSTGMLAILLINQYLVPFLSKIYIAGFSFMEGRNHYFGEDAPDFSTHNPGKEREIAFHIFSQLEPKGILKLDPMLEYAYQARKNA